MSRKCLIPGLIAWVVLMWMPFAAQAGEIEDFIINQEPTAANFSGINARSMAMGQTGIATALDGSAIIYNPAGLARIRRLEVSGGLTQLRLENNTDYERGRYPGYTSVINSAGRNLNKTHLEGLSVVVPAPTYRGSLVFGFGVHRVKNFDRTFKQDLLDTSGDYNFIEKQQTETESGGIYAWSGAAAIELSPRLAIGAGLSIYTGTAKYTAQYSFDEQYYASDIQDIVFDSLGGTSSIESDHLGISGSVGLTYQASPQFTVGAVIESPSLWNVEEKSLYDEVTLWDTLSSEYYWVEESYGNYSSTEYNLRHPFSLGMGVGFSEQQLNLAVDVKYTDWSQMEYTDEFSQDLNAQIQEYYREVLSVRIGAEYVMPGPGLSLRAGFFTDPLPIPSDYIDKDRRFFTFGLGFLIDQVMSVDLAAVIGGYTIAYKDPLPYTEEYKTRRIFLTMAYRI